MPAFVLLDRRGSVAIARFIRKTSNRTAVCNVSGVLIRSLLYSTFLSHLFKSHSELFLFFLFALPSWGYTCLPGWRLVWTGTALPTCLYLSTVLEAKRLAGSTKKSIRALNPLPIALPAVTCKRFFLDSLLHCSKPILRVEHTT